MDVRTKHGNLLGWLNCSVDRHAGFAWYGPGTAKPRYFWSPVVTNFMEGWTAIIVDGDEALRALPHFTALPDDTRPAVVLTVQRDRDPTTPQSPKSSAKRSQRHPKAV